MDSPFSSLKICETRGPEASDYAIADSVYTLSSTSNTISPRYACSIWFGANDTAIPRPRSTY